jgi:hypothetical protein|tara:strand:+ start:173 stop:409 length:237 start_codon:yes stop_codon:yes gene_type:complete
MALTPEQTSQVELQTALIAAQATSQTAIDARRAKLETIRLAKEVLVENRRTVSAADATDITAAAITAMATELATYVSS